MNNTKTKQPSLNLSKTKESSNKTFLHPDATNAYFGNYFAVERSEDDVVLSFGQRLPIDNDEKKVYEIRRRIIMTHKGLKVLTDLLNKVFVEQEKKKK